MLKDFKAFVLRGNLLDLAIGVIMGAAFGKIVSTFTEGIVMPIVGLVLGGTDFKSKFIDLSGKITATTPPEEIEKLIKAGAPIIRYGQLFSDILNFLVVALVMFMLARWAMNAFAKMAAEAPPAEPTAEENLLVEIRDLLKKK